ncbi:AAEL004157-PA [Aedes aegypti]|uniref:AAEL004157-PA n=1 Tax=Aedes aegypti TaxID=7159 RepID=Q0IFS6_AEDAE|nr:AAEL004157-PA [Aedes aegypti]
MKALAVCLVIAVVGVSAVPEYYAEFQQITDDIDSPIHLPVRGNCGKFMKCYGGRAYEQDCPAGLEFGINVNRCDYPALAKCSSNGW